MQAFSRSKVLKLSISLLLLSAPLLSINCGKRKPPAPPLERVSQRPALNGFQKGDSIILTASMAAKIADTGNVSNIKRIDIYRLAEPVSAPLVLSEDDFSAKSTLIDSTDFSMNPTQREFYYVDKITFTNQPIRLRYAIRFVNSAGQKASFSNFFLLEPSSKVAQQPTGLKAQISETAINLNWSAPSRNLDNSIPPNILGYNVYRFIEGQPDGTPINRAPITQENYSDTSFEFGTKYRYRVRTVSSGFEGMPSESSDSEIFEITPQDIFPPSAPQGITIAAAPGRMAIFFASNPEKDIDGYKIFRSVDVNKPQAEWQLMTQSLLKTNTFQDSTIESNQKYFYYILAVDKSGNISKASEVISETAQ